MWIIVGRDSRNDSIVIEITRIIFEKNKKLPSTIITLVNMMNTCYIKI